MPRFVLGINCYLHDSSAALLQDGQIVFAAAEERYSRTKKDARFPCLAIRAALDHAGIGFGDLDAIAFGWNRAGPTQLHTLRAALTGRIAPSAAYVRGSLTGLVRELQQGNGLTSLEAAFGPVDRGRVFFIDHHEAHAWSAYAPSGFDDALVLVMDGRGAWQATTIFHGRDGALTPRRAIPWPNSLGGFYESFTDLLGFERHNDEWKVMGLAAYGKATESLQGIIRTGPRGYKVNGRLLNGRSFNDISALVARFGPRRNPERQITAADQDLAASVQEATERAIFALVREGIRLTGSRRLCLAGGVAMNSKANGKLLASGLIDDIFVQPAATDDGTAIGAALGSYAARSMAVPRHEMHDVYLGSSFKRTEIETTLRTYKLPVAPVQDVAGITARLLARGHIVGWFQGRMEFGPRALGNRSILADPRDPAMKDRVNECVKFREGWRPFAPSCLAERMHEYFTPAYPSPFMILTFDVLPEKRSVIPAVTHADNTARVQTVRRDVNPRYWDVISAFDTLTGVPVVMNTSFNLRGEPIVCTPKDAIRTFFSSGMDALVLGDFILIKPHVRPDLDHILAAAGVVSPNGAAPDAVLHPA
ncbi:MAG: carbamoyltransferase [Chloroflexi bacterium]|nr:carbamoyltransferase [Chloroflexota bacterium]